jgi:hypothetical protein
MPGRPCSGVSLPGSPGVRRAARVHGLGRNRRDPSAWPASGKDRRYKPMVKSGGGQRESEGAVVPVIGVQHNAPGGNGPHFDHAGGEGKRKGMAGTSRSNYPGGLAPAVAEGSGLVLAGRPSFANVRQLQRRLWTAAKQSKERRFHACMTVSAGVTSCGRRGSESAGTAVRPGWIGSPWRSWRRCTGSGGCSPGFRLTSAQAVIVPRPPGAWTSRSQMAASGRGPRACRGVGTHDLRRGGAGAGGVLVAGRQERSPQVNDRAVETQFVFGRHAATDLTGGLRDSRTAAAGPYPGRPGRKAAP